MTNYVLEILDGERAGETLPLSGDRLRIGRRPENDLVIADEKCSGQHAEVVFEEGGWVLRDLGSRNGTMLDGQKVREVALTPFDLFQVGRVRVRFQEEGATAPDDDLQVSRLDAAALAGRKRSPVMTYLLLLVIVAAGGAAAWLQFGGGAAGGAAGGGGQGPSKPLVVDGDQLDGAGNFEQESGWDLRAGGLGFQFAYGATSTGTVALEALWPEGGDGAGPRSRYALARSETQVPVLAEESVSVRATIATEGEAAVGLRVLFSGGQGEEEQSLQASDAMYSTGDGAWVDHTWAVIVPRGFERAEVELIAVLPDATSVARIDDVAFRRNDGSAPVVSATTGNGWTFSAAGGSAIGSSAVGPLLLEVEPITGDPVLAELRKDGLLTMAEAGWKVSFAGEGSQVELTWSRSTPIGSGDDVDAGVATPRVRDLQGVRLVLASGGFLLVRQGDRFTGQDATFTVDAASTVLAGGRDNRCSIEFGSDVALEGSPAGRTYELEARGSSLDGVSLRVQFRAETDQARDLLRQAEAARIDQGPRPALELLERVTVEVPHDTQVLREVQKLQSEILDSAAQRVSSLRRRGNDALFFRAPTGMRTTYAECGELMKDYGSYLPDLPAVEALKTRLETGIGSLDAARAAEHARRLDRMGEAFDRAEANALRDLVLEYRQAQYGK